jgi:hypothetical protein
MYVLYYASMLWCWHLVWILVRTDYFFYEIFSTHQECHPGCDKIYSCTGKLIFKDMETVLLADYKHDALVGRYTGNYPIFF